MAVVRDAGAGLRAVARGATILQLRDPDGTTRHLEGEARRLIATAPVPVLVSSRCDLALATGAYGVHLPERDIPVREARRLLPNALLGRSAHSVDGARAAEAEGADYCLLGPIWPTASHSEWQPLGLETLRQAAAAVAIPVLAIGGVDESRAGESREAGARGFAAIRYFASGAP